MPIKSSYNKTILLHISNAVFSVIIVFSHPNLQLYYPININICQHFWGRLVVFSWDLKILFKIFCPIGPKVKFYFNRSRSNFFITLAFNKNFSYFVAFNKNLCIFVAFNKSFSRFSDQGHFLSYFSMFLPKLFALLDI